MLPPASEFGGYRVAAGTYGGGIFVSVDSGRTWTPMNAGLGNRYVYALTAHDANLFAGTYQGVFLSKDYGFNWADVRDNMGTQFVFSLAAGDSELYAGTYRNGLWRCLLSEILTFAHESVSEIPSSLMLEQNFPNPFNLSTSIRFYLPRRAAMVLIVFNILGQEVATLADGVREAGMHTMIFNANKLASGMYFCRLSSGGVTVTSKMLMLR
jgi:hypothetical protein